MAEFFTTKIWYSTKSSIFPFGFLLPWCRTVKTCTFSTNICKVYFRAIRYNPSWWSEGYESCITTIPLKRSLKIVNMMVIYFSIDFYRLIHTKTSVILLFQQIAPQLQSFAIFVFRELFQTSFYYFKGLWESLLSSTSNLLFWNV